MNQNDYASNLVSFKEGFLGTVRCSPWAAQITGVPVCLIGDASHAIVPFFGQGVNCGFEDVFVLRQHLLSRPFSFESLRDYSLARKKDTDAIADLALENFDEMRSKVADESFMKMKKLDQSIMEAFPHMYRTRYTLIMYTYNPYSACKEIGEIQQKFLQELIAENDQQLPPDIETRIKNKISPHIQRLGIVL
jgi:kynurenine 3-monooxygenase